MKPNLHKFTGYVQSLTAKTWPILPIYLKYFKAEVYKHTSI
jgi:hypothetical protein